MSRYARYMATVFGSKILAYDSFNRADSEATLGNADTGQTWEVLAGTWGITGNKAYKVATAGTLQGAVINTGRNTGIFTINSTLAPTEYSGLCFAATDNDNLLLVQNNRDAVKLWKRISGTFSKLAEALSLGLSDSLHELKIIYDGNTAEIRVDGTSRFTYSLTADDKTRFTTATKAGILSSATTGVTYDSFQAELI